MSDLPTDIDHKARARRSDRGQPHADTTIGSSPPAFEETLNRLDQIVAQLEGGQLALDQALSLYEEGVRLYHLCETMLDGAELRLDRLRISGAPSASADASEIFVETFELDER